MRILVVAATAAEVAPLVARLRQVDDRARLPRYEGPGHDIDLLVTGVGMVATASWTSSSLVRTPYDVALNLGVCGSFRRVLAPGTVVHVVSDRLVEMGAEDGDAFLTIGDLKLTGKNESPLTRGEIENPHPPRLAALAALPAVHGITVNTVHGSETSITRVRNAFNPDVESMEGAAFFYSCLTHGVPCAQVRAVSNIVERRNRASWKLDEAIDALGTAAWQILSS